MDTPPWNPCKIFKPCKKRVSPPPKAKVPPSLMRNCEQSLRSKKNLFYNWGHGVWEAAAPSPPPDFWTNGQFFGTRGHLGHPRLAQNLQCPSFSLLGLSWHRTFPMLNSMQTCNSVTFYFMKKKKSFSSRKALIIFGKINFLPISENLFFHKNKKWRNYKFAWNSWDIIKTF